MRAILNQLLSPEWWFTTIIMGFAVSVAATYLYDVLFRKKQSVEPTTSTGVLDTHSSPLDTASRSRLSDYIVSGHAMLTVLSIMWFFLVMPIITDGPSEGIVFFLAVGLVISIGSVKITKLIAISRPGLLWAVMLISWLLFFTLSAAEINKAITAGFVGRDLAVLLGMYWLLTIATFIVAGGLALLWALIRFADRDQVIAKYETKTMA